MPLDKLAVVARYEEDIGWLRKSSIPHLVVDKSWVPNVGGDATSYLAYIILNYHALPRWCLFMHAHEYHWHHARYSQLRSMRIDVDATGHGFLTISHSSSGEMIWFSKDLLAELSDEEHTSLRRDLLGLSSPYAGRLPHTPCGQFWARRDRILARPRAFYQRLYDVLTNASHPLLSRYAAGEGYPSRMLHVFFVEGYWHYIFGEPEHYNPPFAKYDRMPLTQIPVSAPLVSADEEATPERLRSRRHSFPPLHLTLGGLRLHIRKEQLRLNSRSRNATLASEGTSEGAGDAALSDSRSPRQLLAKVAHGCNCPHGSYGRPPETCKRAADAAVRLLLKLGEQQHLNRSSGFCGALAKAELLSTLSTPKASEQVESLQARCFGGAGGARDYALTALVSCLISRAARGDARHPKRKR